MTPTPTGPRFEGRTAIVTGGGSGIGRESAFRLADEGARVAVADVREDAARETIEVIASRGGDAVAIACDVSDERQVNEMVGTCVDRFGPVDLLHNNAGVLMPGTALTQRIEDFDRHISVNVRGMFLVARSVIPHMQATGRGAIVNTSSTAGLAGEPNCVGYDTSKGAVISLTRQLAIDFARDGIRVNCVCPGWIDTGFNDPILEEDKMDEHDLATHIERSIPLNRQGTAADVAPAVAFLLSDDASYITGHALVIDGGLIAQ